MKITVGKKITGGFLIVVVLVAMMSLFTYFKIGDINDSYEELIAIELQKIELTQGISLSVANEAVAMRRFNFTGDLSDIDLFNTYRKSADEGIAELEKTTKDEKGKKIIANIKRYKAEYESIAEKSISAKKMNDIAMVGQYMQDAGTPYKATMESTEQFLQVVKDSIQKDQKVQSDEADQMQYMLLGINIVVLIFALGLGTWISKMIAGPIRRLTASAHTLADGNLQESDLIVNSADEIGELASAFNQMKDNLQTIIRQVMVTTEQVAASSEELTASAEQSALATNQVAESISEVAQGAEKQASTVNVTTEIVEEMSNNIQQVATNADAASSMANKTSESAAEGEKAVEAAMDQMQSIEHTVVNSAEVVTKLGQRSSEIGQIVETISGIAGQTNLLALNAAIEAARAGEQGKGFAVVAEEVRKLAEQSQEAAHKIATLISEIQSETDSAVSAMQKGTQEVSYGSEVVNHAGRAFKDIVSLVDNVSAQLEESKEAIQKMVLGSKKIVSAVRDIEQISQNAAAETENVSAATQQQSASMEEIASSSQALAKMAEELQNVVQRFKI